MQRNLETKFKSIANKEPRLLDLLSEIDRINAIHKSDDKFCANAYWYGTPQRYGIRHNVVALVGWGRDDPATPYRKTYRAKRSPATRKIVEGKSLRDILSTPTPATPKSILFSPEGYDIAYDFLYARLGDCRHMPWTVCGDGAEP